MRIIHVTGGSGEVDGITRDKLSANPTVGMPRVAGSTDKSKWAASDPVSPVQCPAISVTDDVRGWPVVPLHALVDICQSSHTTVCMAWAGSRLSP